MPKVGMGPIRRKEIIDATIDVIHSEGYDGATLRAIAKQANISAGLMHHYFGSREKLLLATVRHLLEVLRNEVVSRLEGLTDPDERLPAMMRGIFSEQQLRPQNLSAWLVFYVQARKSPEVDHLLRIYHRRMSSNFSSVFRAWSTDAEMVRRQGEAAAALIDGLWLRFGMGENPPASEAAAREAEHFIKVLVGRG